MKRVRLAKDVVAMGEFKTHASRLIRAVKDSRRPLVITQNGKPAAVVIAPGEFDALVERQEFMRAVEAGLADSEHGRVIDDAQLAKEMRDRFGEGNDD